jgi:hypothetical protein
MESTFPGLTRCWKVFQEYSSVFAGYLKQKGEMVAKWWQDSYPTISAWGHGILDVVGIVGDAIPVVGNIVAAVADVLNTVWYAAEGDWVNAGLSAFAIIPYIGTAAKGGKYLGKGLKFVDDIVKLASKYGDNVVQLFSKYGRKIGDLFVKYGDEVIQAFAKYGDEAVELFSKYGDKALKWLGKQGDNASKFGKETLEKLLGREAKEELTEKGLKEGLEKGSKDTGEKIVKENDAIEMLSDSKRVELEAPALRNADSTADISKAKPESVSARDSSVRDSGRIESDRLSDRQIKNELDHIKDNPNLVEGTPPNRTAKIGEHEWHEQPGGGWCRHSEEKRKICVPRGQGPPETNNFIPKQPVHMSPAHSVNTITEGTRFGGGNRNTVKTVAKGDVDIGADMEEINKGQARLLENGDIKTSSERIYGRHPGQNSVFLRSGSPGTVDLTQAEFGVFKQMVTSGGLQGSALKMLESMQGKNPGITEQSREKLLNLFNSRS